MEIKTKQGKCKFCNDKTTLATLTLPVVGTEYAMHNGQKQVGWDYAEFEEINLCNNCLIELGSYIDEKIKNQ